MSDSPNVTSSSSVSEILEGIVADIPGESVSIEAIVNHLKHRGYGPILAILAILVIVIGAIPLVPTIMGLIICFISMQMLLNNDHLWMPSKLKNITVSKQKLAQCIKFITPYAKKLERVLHTRYTFCFNRISEIITALTCLILALSMVTIGFIPMLPAVLSLPIFLFGVGYTVQDGLLIIIGFVIIFGVVWIGFA